MIQWRFLTRFLSPYMFRGKGKFISKNLSLFLSLSFRGFSSDFKSYRRKALGRYSRLNRFINYTQQSGFFAVRNNNSWQAMNLDENKKISLVFFTYDFVPWFYIQDWGNILFLVPPSYEIRYKERGRVNVVSIRRHVNIVFRRHETATEKIASSKNRRIFEVSSQCSNESMKNLTPRN